MAVVAEFVYLMKKHSEDPEPPPRSYSKKRKRLTWRFIKRELFGKGKAADDDEDDDGEDDDEVDLSDSEQVIEKFDDLKEEASTDEEISDGEGGQAAARPPRRGSGYLFGS